MPLVVDASIAVKWVLPEPDSERARALILRGDLTAPDLLRLEVANALWKQARRGAITPERARSRSMEGLRTLLRLGSPPANPCTGIDRLEALHAASDSSASR